MNGSMNKYLAEFVGTFALVFIAAGAVSTDYVSQGSLGLLGMAVASSLVVMAMVYATGHISGAHINPAVTISMLVARKIDLKDAVSYIVAQFTGASIAGLMLLTIFPTAVAGVNLGATGLGSDVDFGVGILVEAILTFMLVLTIFGSAVDERAPQGLAGFAIGVAVLLAILVGGPLTGASMNPARTFGPALVSGYWANHLVYWIGPLIGGVFAALLYEGVFAEKKYQ